MTSFIQNMLWNSVSGFVEEGKRTVGTYAGDALIKAGDLVEGGGRTVGNGIERKATGLGTAIGGNPQKPSAKALPSTARRPAAHRSASLPANTKPTSGVPLGAKKTPALGAAIAKPTSGIPLGAKKNPALAAAKKQPTAAVPSTKSPALRALPSPKPYAVNKPYPASTASLPKPYPTNGAANATPKPYAGAGSKTAVRPGQSKPFAAPKAPAGRSPYPGANANVGTKPYPGTNTLPGQASSKPVTKYKPAQRYEPPAKAGEVKSFF